MRVPNPVPPGFVLFGSPRRIRSSTCGGIPHPVSLHLDLDASALGEAAERPGRDRNRDVAARAGSPTTGVVHQVVDRSLELEPVESTDWNWREAPDQRHALVACQRIELAQPRVDDRAEIDTAPVAAR